MASGRLLLRMDSGLHLSLQNEALRSKVSLNDLCCERLYLPSPLRHMPTEIRPAILAAQKCAGANLLGIVLFGSWARGHPGDVSDIDLLIVLNGEAKISRAIYNKWHEHAKSVGKCEPHFVALPRDLTRISGFWAEIAIDGIVLLDQQQQIQHYLMDVRRALSDGRLYARKVHGQTYWVQSEVE